MVVTDLVLWAARLGVLVLMYLFLLILILTLRAEMRAARAASPAQRPSTPPEPSPARASGPLTLVATGGTLPTTGREFQLFVPLEIGRGSTCDISIPNTFVSKVHARVWQQDGYWYLEDTGSTNGSLVNDQPITAPHRLAVGDTILIGDTKFSVK
ncbi:MAG: FHA domain-containing protein [Armatimonadota bacterium]